MSATARPNSSLQPHNEHHILALREQRVMLNADLAVLYDMQTKVLDRPSSAMPNAFRRISCSDSRPRSGPL